MDAKLFLEALEDIENEKHISKDAIIFALKEALKKAYIKETRAADEAEVRVIIREEPASIDIQHVLEVVDDDEEEDKSLQIALSDAKKLGDYKIGDEFIKSVDPETLSRVAALVVKSYLRQILSEVEKAALYESHKDYVGSLISGVVDKCDDHGALVTIDQSSFTLSRKDLIGDETFKPGSPIQMYLSEVYNGQDKRPTLKLSRSDVGFLKCIIDDEVSDVHSGYVLIKKIVRKAGIRSKVAVYSLNSAIDPIQACIGKGSNTLRNICKRVGTSSQQEKVNFVLYSEDPLVYASEALRPANILKIAKESIEVTDREGNPKEIIKIIAVVGNDEKDYASALGSRGANLKLAQELTGYNIEIIREAELPETDYEDLDFVSVEQLRAEMKQANTTKVIIERANEIQKTNALNDGAYVKTKPQQILDDDIAEKGETEPEVKEEPVIEETPVTSPVVEEEKVAEPAPEAPRVVKTTTTLESLEKSLETSKKKETFKGNTKKRPHKITDDEVEDETKKEKIEEVKKGPQMDIYTAEELEEMENEEYEDNDIDEDVDYEDFEEYYEEN